MPHTPGHGAPLSPLSPAPPIPLPSIGQSAQPAAVDVRPPSSPEEEAQLKTEWVDFFQNPQAQAALLQFAINFGQPVPPGQTELGHGLAAVGAGAQAAGRVTEAQRTRGQEAQAEAREERLVGATERQGDIAQAGLEQRGELAAEDRALQRELAESSNSLRELQLAISAEGNEIERERLTQQFSLAQQQMEAQARTLAARLAAERNLEITGRAAEAFNNIVEAEIANSALTLEPPDMDRVLNLYQSILPFVTGIGPTGGQTAGPPPSDPQKLREIVTNPIAHAEAIERWGQDYFNALAAAQIQLGAPITGRAPATPGSPASPTRAAPGTEIPNPLGPPEVRRRPSASDVFNPQRARER